MRDFPGTAPTAEEIAAFAEAWVADHPGAIADEAIAIGAKASSVTLNQATVEQVRGLPADSINSSGISRTNRDGGL